MDGKTKIVKSQHTFIKTTRLTELNFFNVVKKYGKTVFLSKPEAEKALECISNAKDHGVNLQL